MARNKNKMKDEIDQLVLDILEEDREVETNASIYKTQDKISNMIGRDIQEVGVHTEHMVPVGINQDGDQVITRVQLSCEDLDDKFDQNLSKVQRLDPFLRCCLDALLTLFIHKGGQPFSLNQLYRVLMGKGSGSSPTKKQAEELLRAINTLSRVGITIYLEGEIKNYGEKDGWGTTPQKSWISGTLFPCEQLAIEINGNETIAIRPLGAPILYRYAFPKGQLLAHSMDLISKTKGRISTNRVILLDFLIRYVSMLFMQRKPMANNGLRFDTLYKICGININSAGENLSTQEKNTITKKKKRIRDDVTGILQDWVEIGHIKEFRLEIKGKSPYKVYIEINEKSDYIPFPFSCPPELLQS